MFLGIAKLSGCIIVIIAALIALGYILEFVGSVLITIILIPVAIVLAIYILIRVLILLF